MITRNSFKRAMDSWQYNGVLPKCVAFWIDFFIYITHTNFVFIISFIKSKSEYYSRPIRYPIINLILKYKLRHWSVHNKYYIINRWWNIKYMTSRRLYNERYKKNMHIIAQMSADTNVPQYVLISKYGDLGNWELNYTK